MLTQKFVVVATSFVVCASAIVFPLGKSAANRVKNQSDHPWHFVSNHIQEELSEISDNFYINLSQPVLSKLVFGNEVIKYKKFSSIEKPSHLNNSIELLMRLIIVGSFGSVTIVGSNSLTQRYIYILNQNLILLICYLILLILLLMLSNFLILI